MNGPIRKDQIGRSRYAPGEACIDKTYQFSKGATPYFIGSSLTRRLYRALTLSGNKRRRNFVPPSHINAPPKIPKMMRIKSTLAKDDEGWTMASVLLVTSVGFETAGIEFPVIFSSDFLVSVASSVVM